MDHLVLHRITEYVQYRVVSMRWWEVWRETTRRRGGEREETWVVMVRRVVRGVVTGEARVRVRVPVLDRNFVISALH